MRAVGYICQPKMAQTKRCVRGSSNQSLHIPENKDYLESLDEARKKGYEPCERCHPK